MKFKKLICALLALIVAVLPAACASDDGEPSVEKKGTATVSPASADFTKGSSSDAVFVLTLSSAEFESVTGEGITSDGYSYSAPKITLKAAFLNTLSAGEHKFTVVTTAETDPVITINVRSASTGGEEPGTATVAPDSAEFTKGSSSDAVFLLTLSSAEFESVTGEGITSEGYIYSAPTLTIKAAFLNTLSEGEHEFTVVTTAETDPVITIIVQSALTQTELTGDAFGVTGMIPYDQPSQGAGAIAGVRIATQAYTVSYGTVDATAGKAYCLVVSEYTDNLVSGAFYYKVTDSALTEAPVSLDGWTELADGVLEGTQSFTETHTFYVNLILVSSDVADMGKTVTFNINVAVD